MNEKLAKKVKRFYDSGGLVFYFIKSDDYNGWLKVSIEESDGNIQWSSLSPDICTCNDLVDCEIHDFEFCKRFDLERDAI